MSDNIIKFQRPKKPEQPKQTPPGQKRLLTILGIVAFFALAYLYFAFSGGGTAPGP